MEKSAGLNAGEVETLYDLAEKSSSKYKTAKDDISDLEYKIAEESDTVEDLVVSKDSADRLLWLVRRIKSN